MLALVLVAPVRAAEPTGNTIALPVAIPALPALPEAISAASIRATLPTVVMPEVPELVTLPSLVEPINAANAELEAWMGARRGELNTEFNRLSTRLARARATSNRAYALVGSPMLVTVQNHGQTYSSAYQIAEEMSETMSVSFAYLRGLSRMGTMGLDITFVLLGLAWLMILNLLDLWMHVIALMFRPLLWVIDQFIKTVGLILQLLVAFAPLLRIFF